MNRYRDDVDLARPLRPDDPVLEGMTNKDGIGVSYSDMRVEVVLARIREAERLLAQWVGVDTEDGSHRHDGAGLPTGAAVDMGRAYALLDNANRFVPHVMGWGVGYFWGTRDRAPEDRSWSCFTAHTDIAQAAEFRAAWETKAGDRRDEWIVRFCPCSITKFVSAEADATEFVASTGAFN